MTFSDGHMEFLLRTVCVQMHQAAMRLCSLAVWKLWMDTGRPEWPQTLAILCF